MKKIYIIGNWKSHKTVSEAAEWFEKISHLKPQFSNLENKTIILCPPFELLSLSSALIQEYALPFILGAQDVSPFDEGAHTGEIAAVQLKEFVQYILVGHSERRNLGETDEIVAQKSQQVLKAGLIPVVCVQGKETPVPEGVHVIAYEPVFAIGTGIADTPEDAEEVLKFFKEKGMTTTIYGGSVSPENVSSFTTQPSVDGVLPGKDSLNPQLFADIITNS